VSVEKPRNVRSSAAASREANVLNKLPKSQQPKAKRSLQEIWMAETSKDAEAAFDAFIAAYGRKYDKAAECLAKDRQALLAFYDFPAEHWKYLRTLNPIESIFATVRHRTILAKGCLSNNIKTALAIVFKLVDAARKSWRRLDGHDQLPKLIQGVRLTDGIEVAANAVSAQSRTVAAWNLRPSPKFGHSAASDAPSKEQFVNHQGRYAYFVRLSTKRNFAGAVTLIQ
jgi:putative transposase